MDIYICQFLIIILYNLNIKIDILIKLMLRGFSVLYKAFLYYFP